jgi:endonuclease/exonuclease/phosphatase (EEP) superfamily protein YafD
LLLAIIFILDIGFSVYSNFNIRSSGVVKEIKVMSYNLFFKNKRPNQSIAIIKNANPDIIFIQELTPKWAAEIDKTLGETYKYKMTKPLRGTHGIGIYSKHKISNQEFLNNSSKKPYAQIVDLTIEDKTIQLINTHLASPAIAFENKDKFFSLFARNYQIRKKQIKELNNLASSGSKRYDCQLLVGDLNTLHSEPIFKMLKFRWTNSSNGLFRWMKFNFPHSSRIKPIVTLDYIMGKGKMKFLESKVIKGGSSDHLALLVNLKI